MPDLLQFNPSRDLSFDWHRDLTFDSNRDLVFNPERDLSFDAGRDLGFGKRGPVFRGYVCPICGAQVTADQPSCTECGAVFEPKAGKAHGDRTPPPPKPAASPPGPARAAPPAPAARPPPPPVRAYPPPPKRIDVQHCVYCGARVATADTFCWNCGNRMFTSPGR